VIDGILKFPSNLPMQSIQRKLVQMRLDDEFTGSQYMAPPRRLVGSR
jgi:hypothetical protein